MLVQMHTLKKYNLNLYFILEFVGNYINLYFI